MQQKFWRIYYFAVITSSLFALAFDTVAFSSVQQASSFASIQHSTHSDLGEIVAFLTHGQLRITPEIQSNPSVVRVVVFWMNGCPRCHKVLDQVLPALQEKYGAQLETLLVEVVSMEDVNGLFEVSALYDISREQAAVPLLIIGDHALTGSQQISNELPGLIEHYLAVDGVDWPPIPNLGVYLSRASPNPLATPTPTGAVVHVTLFTTLDCRDCRLVTTPVLGSLMEEYGNQFEVQTIDVATPADVEYLYQVAAGFGIPREVVDLPMLIIADQVLMNEEIPARLPGLVDESLLSGGAGYPFLPPRLDRTAQPVPTDLPAEILSESPAEMRSNGFSLAIVLMALMAGALIYSLITFIMGKTFSIPEWVDSLIPILAFIGFGVAGYLSYVETQLVQAACGPIGDCNAVQSSPYARLFGVMPVGVLGVMGYLAILAAWLFPRLWRNLIARYMPLLVFGLSLLGVLFSLYLTFLEPFMIKAVCMWCLTSAAIMTLLLLLSLKPAIQTFQLLQETDLSYVGNEIETPS